LGDSATAKLAELTSIAFFAQLIRRRGLRFPQTFIPFLPACAAEVDQLIVTHRLCEANHGVARRFSSRCKCFALRASVLHLLFHGPDSGTAHYRCLSICGWSKVSLFARVSCSFKIFLLGGLVGGFPIFFLVDYPIKTKMSV